MFSRIMSFRHLWPNVLTVAAMSQADVCLSVTHVLWLNSMSYWKTVWTSKYGCSTAILRY